MNQNDIHPLQTVTELRLLAAALELQHLTSTGGNLVLIPGGERVIAVGTPAQVARLLELMPTSPASLDEVTGAEGGGDE